MTVAGKLVNQIPVKDANKIYEIFRYRPYEISNVSPTVQGIDLLSGEWGDHGSVICWKFTQDGKIKTAKEEIAVDEAKKSLSYKVLEGDLAGYFKSFIITLHVDTNGETDMIAWTLEYENPIPSTFDLIGFMQLCLNVTKDIDVKFNLKYN